jgi:signal transduction histidine kinase
MDTGEAPKSTAFVPDLAAPPLGEADARRQAARLEAIVQAQHELAMSDAGEEQLTARIAEMAQRLLAADGGTFQVLEDGVLRVRSVCGIANNRIGAVLPLEGSLSGLAVLGRQTVRCDDVETDPRVHLPQPPPDWKSILIGPLHRGDETLGAITVMSRQRSYFTPGDEAALELLAESLAAVLLRRREREEIARLNAGLEERVRQRTEQLEAANAELEAFSYSIAHDLRSPLTSIDGFSRALEELCGAALGDQGLHYLSRIRAGVLQMSELTEAMLSLAHLSRVHLRWERVDLAQASRSVFAQLCENEPQRQATLDAPDHAYAHGDPRLLAQVVTNLVGNAWKFSARKRATRISFGCSPGDGGETVFFVADRGAGFDMTHASRLFGAFQRLHAPSEFDGTGIGLALVQKIVARHGGRIWAQAAPGKGATFYFTLASEPS